MQTVTQGEIDRHEMLVLFIEVFIKRDLSMFENLNRLFASVFAILNAGEDSKLEDFSGRNESYVVDSSGRFALKVNPELTVSVDYLLEENGSIWMLKQYFSWLGKASEKGLSLQDYGNIMSKLTTLVTDLISSNSRK